MTSLFFKICLYGLVLNMLQLLRAYPIETINVISEINFENKFQYIKILDFSNTSNKNSFKIISDPFDSHNNSIYNYTVREMIIKPNEMTLLENNSLLYEDYSSYLMNFKTYKMKIISLLDPENTLKFNLVKASWELNNNTNFLILNDFESSTNQINYLEVFPINLNTKFSYNECFNSLCENLYNNSDSLDYNEYKFKITIEEDLLLYYELTLNQVILVVKDSFNEKYLYLGEVSDYTTLDSKNISTIKMDNLPEEFDLHFSFTIRKQSDSSSYNNTYSDVKYFFNFRI
jgi:hypothetical protein